VYYGVLQACFTWLFFAPIHVLVLALLVSNGWLDAGPVMDVEFGAKVSPVLEVDVALLITMTAWRAFYYGIREGFL
jgi:fumarate reductase subunit D